MHVSPGFIMQYQTDSSLYSSLSRSQVAVPDLLDAAKDADILLFVIPHQFIGRVCDTMKGKIKPDALGMSLIKVPYTREYMHRVPFSLLLISL